MSGALYTPEVIDKEYVTDIRQVAAFFERHNRTIAWNEDSSQVTVCQKEADGSVGVPHYVMELMLPAWLVATTGEGRIAAVAEDNSNTRFRVGSEIFNYLPGGEVKKLDAAVATVALMCYKETITVRVLIAADRAPLQIIEELTQMMEGLNFIIFIDAEDEFRTICVNTSAVCAIRVLKIEKKENEQ